MYIEDHPELNLNIKKNPFNPNGVHIVRTNINVPVCCDVIGCLCCDSSSCSFSLRFKPFKTVSLLCVICMKSKAFTSH